jgi:hypothetical protein
MWSEKSQLACLGCTEAESFAEFKRMRDLYGTLAMTIGSMLSDVQEMIASGDVETARLALNRIKHNIFNEPTLNTRPDMEG